MILDPFSLSHPFRPFIQILITRHLAEASYVFAFLSFFLPSFHYFYAPFYAYRKHRNSKTRLCACTRSRLCVRLLSTSLFFIYILLFFYNRCLFSSGFGFHPTLAFWSACLLHALKTQEAAAADYLQAPLCSIQYIDNYRLRRSVVSRVRKRWNEGERGGRKALLLSSRLDLSNLSVVVLASELLAILEIRKCVEAFGLWWWRSNNAMRRRCALFSGRRMLELRFQRIRSFAFDCRFYGACNVGNTNHCWP